MARMLSANFSLEELCKSQVATRQGIDNLPREPEDAEIIANLTRLCERILQPVRDHYGVPFSPSSGYRCLELNRAIGSKDSSQHVLGQAADFEVPSVANADLAKWIEDNLAFDQLILEFHEPGDPASGWVHCSVTEGPGRQATLTINSAGTRPGLIA